MKKKILMIFIALILCAGLTVVAKNYTSKMFSTGGKGNLKLEDKTIQSSENISKEDEEKVLINDSAEEKKSDRNSVSQNTDSNKKKSTITKAPTQKTPNKNYENGSEQKDNNDDITEDENKGEEPKEEPKKVEKITIKIIDTINNNTIASETMEITDNTVGDITLDLLKNKGISYNCIGGYFRAIGGLKEREAGPYSGWCYYVNGSKPSIGAFEYKVKNGDVVVWKYVEDGVH